MADPFDFSLGGAGGAGGAGGTGGTGGAGGTGGTGRYPDDLDRIELGRLTGSGAVGLGLRSAADTGGQLGRNALGNPSFVRDYFRQQGIATNPIEDSGYLQWARENAAARGRALQARANWWDDPRQIAESGYRSLLGDRDAQSDYFLRTYGFDPFSGFTRGDNAGLAAAAQQYGRSQAATEQRAGLLPGTYGDQFTLYEGPGQGETPYGYRRYRDEFGNFILVDGRGNIIR